MKIPIENIYHLLCYAWNKLEEKDKVKVALAGQNDVLDLLAKVLVNGTRILLKKGIERNYVAQSQEIPGVKGKLELSATLKSNLLLKQRTICTVDDFSANILSNQLLLASLYRLLGIKKLNKETRKEVKALIWMFPPLTHIPLKNKLFKQVKFHRNNQFYHFLLKVCQLIYQSSLPSEKPGQWDFIDFTRDERKMNQLFEHFLRNFYKKEYPQWNISGKYIRWQLMGNQHDLNFLPVMKTDITIQNDREKIIIDAKYYRKTLGDNRGTKRIKSENLYQLFSYLLNQRDGTELLNKTKGILLYPTIEEEYDLHYRYQTHPIQIKTVNLNQHWSKIELRLKEIIEQP